MRSMTGFGRGRFELLGTSYRIEARALNSRFLEVRVKLPWTDPEVERAVIATVRSQLARGRVDVGVWQEGAPASAGLDVPLQLNTQRAQQLGALLQQLAGEVGCDLATAARLIPSVPDLIGSQTGAPDSEQISSALPSGLQLALDGLIEMRTREGAALRDHLVQELDRMEQIVDRISALAADEPQRLQQRLTVRLGQLNTPIALDAGRVAQEAAILADRSDVSEEIARLRAHVGQLRDSVDREEPVGRKIEFVLQELGRELNTTAAKTGAAEITALVVEAKGCAEKMREQAQNVE